VPRKPKSGPKPVMGKPPVQSIVSPRAMLNMPSVATNGGRRKRVITNPLNQPAAAPTRSPATMAPKTVNWSCTSSGVTTTPFFSSPAATAPDKARMAPTDKSMPPARMIKVMPSDRHRLTEICRRMFQPFSGERNLSDSRLSAKTISASAISD